MKKFCSHISHTSRRIKTHIHSVARAKKFEKDAKKTNYKSILLAAELQPRQHRLEGLVGHEAFVVGGIFGFEAVHKIHINLALVLGLNLASVLALKIVLDNIVGGFRDVDEE